MDDQAATSPRAAVADGDIGPLRAGAATEDITPAGAVFLYGYPHVSRQSTGVHDPLECAALYLESGRGRALFIAVDLIWFGKTLVSAARRRIQEQTGLSPLEILISATHTHSGPVTAELVSNAADPVVPKPDPAYIARCVEQIGAAAVRAVANAQPAEIGLEVACAEGVGTNRHDPSGPADPEVPVLVARATPTGRPIGCLLVYGMHPTVLHEDSTLVSGDFPHFTRRFLRSGVLPSDCPVLYHLGAAGDQSPRHVTRESTFGEAQRLGELLGRAVAAAVKRIKFTSELSISCSRAEIDLEPRAVPSVADAERRLNLAQARLKQLKWDGADRPQVRTAECDWFGAEETLELARAHESGRLAEARAECLPAEVQLIAIGPWRFVGWPGEFFVEYALEVKRNSPSTFVITLANGDLQGYIVTEAAAARGVYESGNAVFAPSNGRRFVESSLDLLRRLG